MLGNRIVISVVVFYLTGSEMNASWPELYSFLCLSELIVGNSIRYGLDGAESKSPLVPASQKDPILFVPEVSSKCNMSGINNAKVP